MFFFSQFHLSILGWLRIRLCDLFWYTYYEVISISWLRSWVWQVERGWLESFLASFFYHSFLQFYLLSLSWLRIKLHNLFQFFFSIGLSLFHNSRCGFGWLIQVDLGYFFLSFFNFFQIHPLILSLLEIEFLNLFWFDLYVLIFSKFFIVSCTIVVENL